MVKSLVEPNLVEELIDAAYGDGFYSSQRGIRVIKTNNSLLGYKEQINDGVKTIRIHFTVEERKKDTRNCFLFLLNYAVNSGTQMIYFAGKEAHHIREVFNWFDDGTYFRWQAPDKFVCNECSDLDKCECLGLLLR